MDRFISGLVAGLYVPVFLLLGIFVVAVALGTFVITAWHGQEIYA